VRASGTTRGRGRPRRRRAPDAPAVDRAEVDADAPQAEPAAAFRRAVAGGARAVRSGDLPVLQQSLGNRSTQRLLAGPAVQRAGAAAKETKHPGPAPETPFDAAHLPPGAAEALDALALDALRSLTNDKVNHAYTNFMQACTDVKGKLEGEKKAREESEKKTVEMAIGAVGMLLGPVGAAVGAKVAGPQLQTLLKHKIVEKVPGTLMRFGVDPKTAVGATEQAFDAIASERVAQLAAKLTPDKAAELVGSAAKKVADATAKVDVQGGDEDKAIAYVDALMRSGDRSSNALLTAVGTNADAGALMATYQQFAGATFEVYRAEVETKARHFMTQVAGTVGGGKRTIVLINAYGRERLANVRYLSDSANYVFHSWVTPDMESVVRGLHPDPLRVPAGAVTGHLPEPAVEGAVYGEEQIVRVDAYGRRRLAVVKADTGFFVTNYGEIHFVRWVAADEEAVAEVKGAAQMAGIPDLDPGRLAGGFPKPAE
jgi:hypothetical protein